MLFLPRGRRDDSPRSAALAALELQMSVFVVSKGVGGGGWGALGGGSGPGPIKTQMSARRRDSIQP